MSARSAIVALFISWSVVFLFFGIEQTRAFEIVPCDGVDTPCQACHFIQLGKNIIDWFIEVMVAVIAFVFAWAGVKMVMSAGNSEGVTSAKHMMTNALIGFVILLAGWLIIDTVLKTFVADSRDNPEAQQLGTWNEIQCTTQPTLREGEISGVGVTGGIEVGGTGRIPEAMDASFNMSTASGPGRGRVACAWAVNKVLQSAGVAPIDGNVVKDMERELRGGRGTQISQSQAHAGDIVIEASGHHVGFCMNDGCTRVLSNSSSRQSFTWKSGPDFRPSYSGGPGRFYRVKQ